MPFDGSAIARSHSAEYLHTARQRSQSQSSLHSAGSLRSPGVEYGGSEAEYHAPTIPAYVGAVSRFNEEYDKRLRPRPPLSPRQSGRSTSGFSGRRGNTLLSPVIAEEDARQAAADSDSSHTAAEDRDVERGELTEEEPRLFVVPATTPKVFESTSKQTNALQTEKSAAKPSASGEGTKKEPGQPPRDQQQQQQQQKEKEKEKEKDPFLVTLEGREHLNPHTWNETYRWFLTALAGFLVRRRCLTRVTATDNDRSGAQCHLRVKRTVASNSRYHRLFRRWARSWDPYHCSVRRGLLRRSDCLGSIIRTLRSKNSIYRCFHTLCWLPSGRRCEDVCCNATRYLTISYNSFVT